MGSCVICAPVGWVSVDAIGWYLIDMSAEMLANSWSPYRLTPSLLGWHWSADSRLTCWLTDRSVDCVFFLLLLFHLLHLFQSTTITIIITKHTCTHGLHTQAHMQFYNHYTMVLVGMLTDSRQTLMGYWHSADTLLILSQWYILCLLKL